MAKIICVVGEKGGVGKSLVCLVILQLLLDHQVDFQPIETDRSNPDCYRIYSRLMTFLLCVFSESERLEDSANNIFNSGVEKITIVNTPAQILPAMKLWFTNNQILDIAKEAGVEFWFFFVTDGGYDSIKLLQNSLEYFHEGVRHVVVKNEGRNEDWVSFDTDKQLQRLLKKYEASMITFPKLLGSVWKNRMLAEPLAFQEALVHPECGLIDRQRIKRFLTTAYQEFLTTGAFSDVIQPK